MLSRWELKNMEEGLGATILPHGDRYRLVCLDLDSGGIVAVIMGQFPDLQRKALSFITGDPSYN